MIEALGVAEQPTIANRCPSESSNQEKMNHDSTGKGDESPKSHSDDVVSEGHDVMSHGDAISETAPPRGTCLPSAVAGSHHAELHAAENAEVSREEENYAVPDDTKSSPPDEVEKTARPGTNHRAKCGGRGPRAKSTEKATAGLLPKGVSLPKKKKKTVEKINIKNVERKAPIPEGVTTPRSLELCATHGVSPNVLAPYKLDHFKGPGVSEEMAELRYSSYDKRRKAHMAVLREAYRSKSMGSSVSSHPAGVQLNTTLSKEGTPNNGASGKAGVAKKGVEEDAKMQKQFDEQHQRLLEMEHRKSSAHGYDSDGRRLSPARSGHARGTSPRSGGGHVSPGRLSVSTSVGRPTVGQPYSAMKIYSNCAVEDRPLTQSEAVMVENIYDREARRIDAQERASMINENKQLMYLARELEREKRSTELTRRNAEERERKQEESYLRGKSRREEVLQRRHEVEVARRTLVEESILEKEGRIHASDPYASIISRHRPSGASVQRASKAFAAHEETVGV